MSDEATCSDCGCRPAHPWSRRQYCRHCDEKAGHGYVYRIDGVERELLADVRDYLERVCDWYEGGELPGEIAAKRLIVRLAEASGE